MSLADPCSSCCTGRQGCYYCSTNWIWQVSDLLDPVALYKAWHHSCSKPIEAARYSVCPDANQMLEVNRISAISITAANATNELFEVMILIVILVPFLITKGQNIARKQYQVVIVSPEILNNDSRFEDLWSTKRFTDNLVNLVLDEAHVVKEWGGTFRSDYLRIGPIRYLLTRKPTVGIHLGTATMPNISTCSAPHAKQAQAATASYTSRWGKYKDLRFR